MPRAIAGRFDLERERDYRNGDSGYNRSFGDRDRYRDELPQRLRRRLPDGLQPLRIQRRLFGRRIVRRTRGAAARRRLGLPRYRVDIRGYAATAADCTATAGATRSRTA